MATRRGRSTSPQRSPPSHRHSMSAEDDSLINTRQLEALGRTVHATASQLISSNFAGGGGGGGDANSHHPHQHDAYRSALSSVHRSMRRPMIQRSVFSFAKANPRELIRSNFDTSEIEHRALTYLPDDLLRNIPQSRAPFSLLEGFKASLPDEESLAEKVGKRRRHGSKGQKLLQEEEKGPPRLMGMKKEKLRLDRKHEMMGVRKTMCASEIKEIDDKIANLNTMRKVILDRLADLEQEEHDLEQELVDMAERIEVAEEEIADEAALATKSPTMGSSEMKTPEESEAEDDNSSPGFMSESIYQKLPKESPTPKNKRKRPLPRRISMPVLHEHMEPGSRIRELQAHNDTITALDFDAPFGTMVTAALDDTVRVWDLNAGRCMGLLEGHLSSVRCLQVEENIVATGSMDASIRLWDLSQADYTPPSTNSITDKPDEDQDAAAEGEPVNEDSEALFTDAQSSQQPQPQPEPHGDAMADCPLFTLNAHVAEVTALNFRGSTLVSGSADKTLRQWDLEKGRCVQTLDVLWAAAQANTISPPAHTKNSSSEGGGGSGGWWRPTSNRVQDAHADFIGALQVFDAALAVGTADGMVRLWDLRSGHVHRSLVGHTGPVTALQFDDVFLVTGSADRSIRIWDLRTGTIHDAFAYDAPITSMNFDARRIVAAAGEDVVKVYDKTDGRQWDCGAGGMGDDGVGKARSVVERVRIKDGYMVEGRKDGVVGVWSC